LEDLALVDGAVVILCIARNNFYQGNDIGLFKQIRKFVDPASVIVTIFGCCPEAS
jgi:hypothetical protein